MPRTTTKWALPWGEHYPEKSSWATLTKTLFDHHWVTDSTTPPSLTRLVGIPQPELFSVAPSDRPIEWSVSDCCIHDICLRITFVLTALSLVTLHLHSFTNYSLFFLTMHHNVTQVLYNVGSLWGLRLLFRSAQLTSRNWEPFCNFIKSGDLTTLCKRLFYELRCHVGNIHGVECLT